MFRAARVEGTGELRAVLPLYRVRSRVFGTHLMSVPFMNYGGPVGTPEARETSGMTSRLLLTYTDQYPDVVRINHQIDDLQKELSGSRRSARSSMPGSAGTPAATCCCR